MQLLACCPTLFRRRSKPMASQEQEFDQVNRRGDISWNWRETRWESGPESVCVDSSLSLRVDEPVGFTTLAAISEISNRNRDRDTSNSSTENSCIICLSRPRTVRMFPCGHALCCAVCTVKTINARQRKYRCPTCRADVEELVVCKVVGDDGTAIRRMPTLESLPVSASERDSTTSVVEFLRLQSAESVAQADAQLAQAARDALVQWDSRVDSEDYGEEDYESYSDEGSQEQEAIDDAGHSALPDGTTQLNEQAYHNSQRLISLALPPSLTSVGMAACYQCSHLTAISLPEGVTAIGRAAFSNCASLANLDLPASLATIDAYAFDGCAALPSLTLPANITTVAQFCFRRCSSLATLTLSPALTSIDKHAFDGCTRLAVVQLPSGVASVGVAAFRECTSLHSVSLPAALTCLRECAFEGCASLAKLELPDAISQCEIGDFAFARCDGLSAALRERLEEISPDAFTEAMPAEGERAS